MRNFAVHTGLTGIMGFDANAFEIIGTDRLLAARRTTAHPTASTAHGTLDAVRRGLKSDHPR